MARRPERRGPARGSRARATRRFITTPRDLAVFVNDDFLYQGALGACLVLLARGAPFEGGLPCGPDHPWRTNCATFGAPHVLALLAEASSRALRICRRQKFCVHRRARPEALAGMLTLAASRESYRLGGAETRLKAMVAALEDCGLADLVEGHNAAQNAALAEGNSGTGLRHLDLDPPAWMVRNLLLPVAFADGAPMHPAYGSAHATVAGTSITILKAMFEMYRRESLPPHGTHRWKCGNWQPMTLADIGMDEVFVPTPDGNALVGGNGDPAGLTLAGELDKLASNIGFGCVMAGINHASDVHESLRLGERIAVGILQEQMLNYSEPVSMRFPGFDGDRIVISTMGSGADVSVEIRSADDQPIRFEDWWQRPLD
ncbi:hypothetical protein [Methylobrevis pamukkalensis]|uniref:Uncharacterized protein n=1 Tax=Methylobrevis pamukkalensis TaxID=1439726 RepID=A0A1E3H293_9HYPH|nr:hypothetical protein [Methylobrevis pamukkalensis]ODN70448.1 hypothetical protein A6302_02251 [Methylobrevis pamukkalensis]